MPVITAARVRSLLPVLSGTGEDAELETLIDVADAQIAQSLGLSKPDSGTRTLGSATYTLTHPDVTLPTARLVYLPLVSITAITSLHSSELQVFDSSSLISSDDYRLDSRTGAIRMKPTATDLNINDGCVQVVAVAGWADLTTEDVLAQAVAMHTRHLWTLRRNQGQSSVSEGGGSASLRDETIPAVVEQMIAPYRRMIL